MTQQEEKIQDEIQQLMQENSKLIEEIENIKKQNDNLSNELSKFKEIATNTQSQYVNLKYDFDWYIARQEKESSTNKVKFLIESFKQFLPFIEQLWASINHIPSELLGNPWVDGTVMLYENIVKKINGMWFYHIESIWLEPNPMHHEALMTEPCDENMKWKIVKELEKWYVYRSGDDETVIRPAKVVVWS